MKNQNSKQNKTLRKQIKAKGFNVYRLFLLAKIAAFILSRLNMQVYWVFAEEYGFMVINIDQFEVINKARMKNNFRRLHVRDMDKTCVFRTPKKAWGTIKINKHKKQ